MVNSEALLTAKGSQGNTVAHLVADSGNTEVFKVYNIYFVTVIRVEHPWSI